MIDVDRIAAANLLPPFLKDMQRKEDSIRARKWFEMTKDSTYIKKYITSFDMLKSPAEKKESPASKKQAEVAILTDEKLFNKSRPYFFITS